MFLFGCIGCVFDDLAVAEDDTLVASALLAMSSAAHATMDKSNSAVCCFWCVI